jgi:hypothetical protein
MARRAGAGVALDDVAGAVAAHGEAGPPERGHDELAGGAVGQRVAGLAVRYLGHELVLTEVQTAGHITWIPARSDLGQPGVVEPARARCV